MTKMMQRMYHVAVVCPGFGLGGPCRGWGVGHNTTVPVQPIWEKKVSFLTLVTSDTVTQPGHVDIQQ